MDRHSVSVWGKLFCTVFMWMFLSGICFAEIKQVRPTTIPDKPAASTKADAKQEKASEKRGRAPKEEPMIRVGLSDGQASASLTADTAYTAVDALTGQSVEKFSG